MRRIIPLTLLALTLIGGVAFADRDRDRRWGGRDRGGDRHDRRDDRRDRRDDHRDHRGGGVVVRDNRGPVVVRDHRGGGHYRRPVVRNRIYVNNGNYVFGNRRVVYHRPYIRQRFYDVRVRPVVLVENMEAVPGYVWVRGNWNWNGYEWVWVSGHYAPDTRYQTWYDDGTYDAAPGVNISGGVSVGF